MSDTPEDGITERVAAILAADAVGYSRLMADDEQATVKTLDQARDVFRRHVEANRGRVVDTAGDSVLAVFETTSGAVRASMAIQEGLQELNADTPSERQMHFRIGIHLGDIMEKPSDGTIYGDGVNVAARLEALSRPGGIAVSSSVHDSIRDRLDVGFEFLGEHEGKNLKTPVKAYRVLAEGEEPGKTTGKPRIPLKGVIAAGIAAIVVVAGAALLFWTENDEPPESVWHLPVLRLEAFASASNEAQSAATAAMLTDDVSNGLAKFHSLRLVSQSEIAEITTEYVMRGRVTHGDDELRVAVELIRESTGQKIWGQTYEEPWADESTSATISEIAARIISNVADPYGAISTADYQALSVPDGSIVSSMDCVPYARFAWSYASDAETHVQIRECLEILTNQQPDNSEAWAWMSLVYLDEANYQYPSREGFDALSGLFKAARTTLELAPHHELALVSLGIAHFLARDYEQSMVVLNDAITKNPYNSLALGFGGLYLPFAGDWDNGLPAIARARQLNPKAPNWLLYPYIWYHVMRDEYAEAASVAQTVVVDGDHAWTHAALAVAYAHMGRLREARTSVDRVLERDPAFAEGARDLYAFWFPPDGPWPGLLERILSGLEKAGLFDETEAPSRPIIAVLPFDNLSGDPEQEYFADGITEDIITRLAQYPDILVLGRNTTFQFKGEAVDIPTIAEKLGADYVVEGSIRRGGDTVRVTAQLLGGDEWGHVWAETYDRKLDPENLFAIQDEITEAVATRIGDPYGAIGRAEVLLSSRQSPESLSSYECALKYFAHLQNFNPETHRVARDCLEEVVETEPGYGEALAFLGNTYIAEVAFGFNVSIDSSLRRALDVIERGLAINPESGRVRVLMARALYLTDSPERAIREAEGALLLDPNNVEVLAWAGAVFVATGTYNRAVETMNKVALLNPNYPVWMNWILAKAHIASGEYSDAITRVQMTQMEWWYWTQAFMAAAYCASGETDRGKDALATALELKPEFAEVFWQEQYFWNKGPDVRPMLDAVSAGLEICGWDVPPDPGPEAFAN